MLNLETQRTLLVLYKEHNKTHDSTANKTYGL